MPAPILTPQQESRDDTRAKLTALTIAAGATEQPLSPRFNDAINSYTIPVANTVTQIAITASPFAGATVAYQQLDGTVLGDADTDAPGFQLNLPDPGPTPINLLVTHAADAQTYTILVVRAAIAGAQPPCSTSPPPGRDAPVPAPVTVWAVPIVVDSTTDDYFVLFVRHELDTTVEMPVAVTLGRAGTTTLAENLAALPKERYRVEKFRIDDPADTDGDCIDDITELNDPLTMNPLNPAPSIASADGAMAVPDQAAFQALSYVKEDAPDGFEYVKFVLLGFDTDRPRVYFMNSDNHRYHETFRDALGLAEDQPGMLSGTIVYHPDTVAPDGSLGVFHYEYCPISYLPFNVVALTQTVLAASMPLIADNLVYYMPAAALPPDRREFNRYDASRINLMFDQDVVAERDFVSINAAEGYGLLRVMELGKRPNPRDVVIYEALPNELSRVAGIITTVPQTPLSHVNLRAVQDGIPNAFIRDILDDANVTDLIGTFVHYKADANGWSIRAASPAEVDAYYAASRPTEVRTPQRNLTISAITPLSDIGFEDWTAFGVKAANLATLRTFRLPAGTVPDGFAVPFYFYDQFMKFNGFYAVIEAMLADRDFQTDLASQETQLKRLRDEIRAAPMPTWMTAALTVLQQSFPEGTSIRCRSSTNNEDLPGFSGAGLYDSKTQHPREGHISKCIKQVYASLWNFRAFSERHFHRIDHAVTAMAVLTHPNYSNELANGVAVSFDPVYGSEATYYVNTQVGEDLVTNPDALSVPEELLLKRSGSHTVVATSNRMPAGQLIMSDDQLDQLRRHLAVIHRRFAALYNVEPGGRFAIEIEFKITSDNILAIKQARPWVFPGETP